MNAKINIGIGFRRDIADEIIEGAQIKADFIELAPENWIAMGGFWKQKLDQAAEKYPITCHGLSLSLGSPEKLDMEFLKLIKQFLKQYNVQIYSEHLSFSKCDNAHVYDLLPIPFREDAVEHVAERIRVVQDFLERKIAIENVSYYTPVAAQMNEATFINRIVEESDCQLLLDVNNVYVNAFNHGYNAKGFLEQMPLDKVAYMHIAGHEQVSDDLIIDTHGEAIVDPVYDLFKWTLQRMDAVPILLERDFNFPEVNELQEELGKLKNICTKEWEGSYVS